MAPSTGEQACWLKDLQALWKHFCVPYRYCTYCQLLRCRDRAEERRKGLNPDYERTAMSGLPTDAPLNPTMSVEETKYLGGDLEHTHLVKGLDYALLQKVCATWQGVGDRCLRIDSQIAAELA